MMKKEKICEIQKVLENFQAITDKLLKMLFLPTPNYRCWLVKNLNLLTGLNIKRQEIQRIRTRTELEKMNWMITVDRPLLSDQIKYKKSVNQ